MSNTMLSLEIPTPPVVAGAHERAPRALHGIGPHVRRVRHLEQAGALPQRLQLGLQPVAQPVA